MELIAELGTTHAGDLDKARALLDEVAEAGFDTAKFQWVIAEEILHPKTGDVSLPGGVVPLFERFRDLQRDTTFYSSLKEATEERGLSFLCTPFGPESLRLLVDIGAQRVKIASPELSYLPLLESVRDTKLPLIASTGVSRISDIEEALQRLGGTETTFLHCVTAYPAPPEDYNLNSLETRRAITGTSWGVSDHSLDPLVVPLTSAALGATVLEKHVTLRKDAGGLDDPVALSPDEFRAMVHSVREVERAGTAGEATAAMVRDRIGDVAFDAACGSKQISLAPCEVANYGRTNRSLHARYDLAAGTTLHRRSIAMWRTEKNLRPGLHPRYLNVVEGAVLQRGIPAGDGIVWDDIVAREPTEHRLP